ncbi:Uncharacterized protein APZ42_032080 [Daphnia magna]|uniref:Uncharacterized protein n=1 Tax=Daphnia magna TaxID=35525 RepID=A0A164MAY6_9CRUS|nr:Uncharacterized protein APZ42_032080 [Daphnia magna]
MEEGKKPKKKTITTGFHPPPDRTKRGLKPRRETKQVSVDCRPSSRPHVSAQHRTTCCSTSFTGGSSHSTYDLSFDWGWG